MGFFMSSTNAHSVDIAVVSVPAVKKSYKSKALLKKKIICDSNFLQTFKYILHKC